MCFVTAVSKSRKSSWTNSLCTAGCYSSVKTIRFPWLNVDHTCDFTT